MKKISKWMCKVCGEKQTLKHEYGRGTGIECRLRVQKLNIDRIENEDATELDGDTRIVEPTETKPNVPVNPGGVEKWLKYVEENVENEQSENILGLTKLRNQQKNISNSYPSSSCQRNGAHPSVTEINTSLRSPLLQNFGQCVKPTYHASNWYKPMELPKLQDFHTKNIPKIGFSNFNKRKLDQDKTNNDQIKWGTSNAAQNKILRSNVEPSVVRESVNNPPEIPNKLKVTAVVDDDNNDDFQCIF